jgi:hypothetical protein
MKKTSLANRAAWEDIEYRQARTSKTAGICKAKGCYNTTNADGETELCSKCKKKDRDQAAADDKGVELRERSHTKESQLQQTPRASKTAAPAPDAPPNASPGWDYLKPNPWGDNHGKERKKQEEATSHYDRGDGRDQRQTRPDDPEMSDWEKRSLEATPPPWEGEDWKSVPGDKKLNIVKDYLQRTGRELTTRGEEGEKLTKFDPELASYINEVGGVLQVCHHGNFQTCNYPCDKCWEESEVAADYMEADDPSMERE